VPLWTRRPVIAQVQWLSAVEKSKQYHRAGSAFQRSYPYGWHDAGVREDAESAGYGLAFTASGYGPVGRSRLPRRPGSGWDPMPLF
jgi:hypothetical protein